MNSELSTNGSKRTSGKDRLRPSATPPLIPADAAPAKPLSKQQTLADLLIRDSGATIEQMISATGWLPHTARAAPTGLKKKGYELSSDKVEGVRTYRAVAPE